MSQHIQIAVNPLTDNSMRLSTLHQYLNDIKQRLNAKLNKPSTSVQSPALSVANVSTLSLGDTTPGAVQLYISPSGHNFVQVQASTNDDMDLSPDFFVPPTNFVDDPIITDAEADALAAAQQAAAEVVQQINKASLHLKLKESRTASGYQRFWDNVKKTLPRTVPTFYNLILANCSLSDIMGYDDEDGWKKGSSSFNVSNPLSLPSDASQLVADCFSYIFGVYYTQLQTALDSDASLESLHNLPRMVEDSTLHLFTFFFLIFLMLFDTSQHGNAKGISFHV